MPFLHPIFLFSLLAVGVPIVIHLSRRRKFKQFEVGTLRFLRLAERKRNLRLRVEEWPLLLLRIAAVILFALLFSRPFFSGSDRTEMTREKTIVLLDASGSMTAAMADRARAAAIRAVKEDSTVMFARFSDTVEPLADPSGYQPIAGAPGDSGHALAWALDHLRSEGIESARVVIAGHFSAAAMPSAPPRVWPPGVRVDAIAIDPPSSRNAAVLNVELLTPFETAAMEIEARVTPSDSPREISLAAEGLNLKQRIPAGSGRVLFSFRPPREEVRGWVSIEGKDDWPVDDSRPFAFRWAKPEPVLILDGFPGSTPFEGQGYFLGKALSASGAAHGLSPFRPEIRYDLEGRNGNLDPGTCSALAICGPTGISRNEASLIEAFVNNGGGLLIVIDGRWSPTATASLEARGLFPGQVAMKGGQSPAHLAGWDRNHPALADFDEKEGGDLRLLTWRDGFTIRADPSWQVLATLEGGSPLLLEKVSSSGQGRVMVLAHPLTREWSDVAREPLFVPFVKSLFASLTGYEAVPHSANVRFPGIRENRAIGHHAGPDGVMEVIAGDPGESMVSPVDAAFFRKAFGLPVSGETPAAVHAPESHPERPRDGEWWPWLALALLLLLAAESVVATRVNPSPAPHS